MEFPFECLSWYVTSERIIKIDLLYTYRDLRAKKHRDKNSLFTLEKPADSSYDFFFTSEKRRIDALIGYIIIFTSEQNRIARSPLLLTDNISKSIGAFFFR